jgi:hypothetical protein
MALDGMLARPVENPAHYSMFQAPSGWSCWVRRPVSISDKRRVSKHSTAINPKINNK